jgi:hypothetical protein
MANVMCPSKSTQLVISTIATTFLTAFSFQLPAQAQRSVCYEVQDSDGWSYVRNLLTREVVGKLSNKTTFRSMNTTSDGNVIIGGFREDKLIVSRNRVRPVDSGKCRWKYWMVADPDGYINLRSAPNGSIIGRINDLDTVLQLERSTDNKWSRVITPQGEIGWIHSSRLAEIST